MSCLSFSSPVSTGKGQRWGTGKGKAVGHRGMQERVEGGGRWAGKEVQAGEACRGRQREEGGCEKCRHRQACAELEKEAAAKLRPSMGWQAAAACTVCLTTRPPPPPPPLRARNGHPGMHSHHPVQATKLFHAWLGFTQPPTSWELPFSPLQHPVFPAHQIAINFLVSFLETNVPTQCQM